jgi:hypothetical protein
MAQSKQSKDRANKKEEFKEKAKKEAAQAAIPKTHLIPETTWQTTDVLDLRGGLLEILEKQMVLTFEKIQQSIQVQEQIQAEFAKAGQVMQMIMGSNIKSGKIKLSYKWNNGEDATEEDVAKFKAQMEEISKKRIEQVEEFQKNSNAAKTGLVTPEGEPLGSTQSLDDDDDQEDDITNEVLNDVNEEGRV